MKAFRLESYMKLNIKIIKLLGLWPENGNYWSSKIYLVRAIIINVFFVALFNISMTVNVFYLLDDLEYLMNTAYVVTSCLIASFKSIFLLIHNRLIQKLVLGIKREGIQLNANQHNILHKYISVWKMVHSAFVFVASTLCVLWGMYPLLDAKEKQLPFPSWYPYDFQEGIFYPLTYLHQFFGITSIVFLNSNMDTMTSGLMAYIAAECDVLSDVVKNFRHASEQRPENLVLADMDYVNWRENYRFLLCVDYHKRIVEYAEQAGKFFDIVLLFQFASSALSTAMAMFNMTLHSPGSTEFLAILMYQLGVFMELLIYCWYGNEVMVKSSNVAYAAFASDWPDASKDLKINVHFFMLRTQKPITISAVNFFALSLSTFISVLRAASSYFTLLRQMHGETKSM